MADRPIKREVEVRLRSRDLIDSPELLRAIADLVRDVRANKLSLDLTDTENQPTLRAYADEHLETKVREDVAEALDSRALADDDPPAVVLNTSSATRLVSVQQSKREAFKASLFRAWARGCRVTAWVTNAAQKLAELVNEIEDVGK